VSVLTFRASGPLSDLLRTAGPRFFHAPWGTRWGDQVIGTTLAGRVDWAEIELLLTESYRLLASRRANGNKRHAPRRGSSRSAAVRERASRSRAASPG
jgi:hypothetical protein